MSPRILLVDDETNIRKMVGALLQSEGFETAEAANGSAALAAVEREAPDAVLLDLMMPGGPDGLATLEQLKRLAPDVPVVMMSGKASLTDAVRATKLGAFQFLEKPLTPEGVVTIADHGPGVPDELRQQVFEPYFTTKQDGTGLGLALVRQTIEAHNGTIRATDTPGGGATFSIVLAAI